MAAVAGADHRIVLIAAEPAEDRKVAIQVKRFEGLEKVFLVSGLYAIVVRIPGKSAEEILALLCDKIRPMAGVRSSHTMFGLEV